MMKFMLFALALSGAVAVAKLPVDGQHVTQTQTHQTVQAVHKNRTVSQSTINRDPLRQVRQQRSASARLQRHADSTLLARSVQVQSTSFNLDASELKAPLLLTVKSTAAGGSLSGSIKLNGKTLGSLSKDKTEVDLAKHLSRGQHKIEVLGSYTPSNAGVEISLVSDSSEISQAMSGSGQIHQIITLDIN